ncbi:MAG: EAL domain-containing protein [Stagnimonas sp.]|nr:EAL domain-containing protein [Stagnimonas sp.]
MTPGMGKPPSASKRQWSLDALRRRYGSLRVNVLACWVLVSLYSVVTTVLVSELFTRPGVLALAGSDALLARLFTNQLLLLVLGVVAGLSVLSFALLYWGLIRPVENHRSDLHSRLSNVSQETGSERALTGYQLQRCREQLDLALVDNEELREELTQARGLKREADALLAAVLDRVSDPILLTDRDGQIIEATRSACDLLALRRGRLVGREFDELFDPGAALRLASDHGEKPSVVAPVLAMRSAIAKPQELRFLGNDEPRNLELSLSCALGEDTRVLGLIASLGSRSRRSTDLDPVRLLQLQRDPVTRLPNQELFERRATELVETARAQMSYHTLMLIGIDNLVDVTERHGLKAAEQLRWQVSRLVEEHAGPEREVFQASHGHIGVLCPYKTMTSQTDFADRLCLAITSRPYAWRDAQFESTISIGAVEISPLSEGMSELLEHANQACVIARQTGGNQAHLLQASPALMARRRNDNEWISWALPRLEQGYAHLISQAVVPLQSGEDAPKPLFECFVRIEDEDGIWVSPESFLPAMERRQLSQELDLWVIGAVLRELANRPKILEDYDCAGINISAASLRAADFADRVAALLERSKIEGSRLCFEINESDVASHTADALAFIERMRPLGIRFALDRYRATGGLHSLRDTPIDYVKIHPSLLSRLHGLVPDPIDLLHVSWINRICQARGIAVVATGIEYEDVARCLREAEFAYGQGIHLNKIGPILT